MVISVGAKPIFDKVLYALLIKVQKKIKTFIANILINEKNENTYF